MEVLKVKHDSFCWTCHENDTEGDCLKCTKCIRSFHFDCLANDVDDIDGQCPVCTELIDEQNASKPELLKALPIILNRIFENSLFNPMKYSQKGCSYSKSSQAELIVNPISLMSIREKIHTYTSLAEFLVDIKWIVHNSIILYSGNHEKAQIARMLLGNTNAEIESAKKCIECYENAINEPTTWFTIACSQPHLMLWAKMKGFTFWPAKLMSIDGQMVNVRFFGDHTHADVPATNCFLYSGHNPDKRRSATTAYNSAIKEARSYADNVRIRFGSFAMSDSKVRFNPALYNKYIDDMLPGFAERRASQLTSNSNDDNDDSNEMCEGKMMSGMEDDDASNCSEESTTIRTQKMIRVTLERIDQKQTETGQNEKKLKRKVPNLDELVRKLPRLSESGDDNVTVDLNIESIENDCQNSETADDVQIIQLDNSLDEESCEMGQEVDMEEMSEMKGKSSSLPEMVIKIATNDDQIDESGNANQPQAQAQAEEDNDQMSALHLIQPENWYTEHGKNEEKNDDNKNFDVKNNAEEHENGNESELNGSSGSSGSSGTSDASQNTVDEPSSNTYKSEPMQGTSMETMPDIMVLISKALAIDKQKSQQQLDQLNVALEAAVKEKCDAIEEKSQAINVMIENKHMNAELKEKNQNLVKSSTLLQREIEALHANIDKLMHDNAKLKQLIGKRSCMACGKFQNDLFHCNEECLNYSLNLKMEAAMLKDEDNKE